MPDEHSLGKDISDEVLKQEFLTMLDAALDQAFQQYWLFASKDGVNIASAGKASPHTMETFALELLRKVVANYKVQGAFDYSHPMIEKIRFHLQESMNHIRQLRAISHEVQDMLEEERKKQKEGSDDESKD